MVMWCTLTWSSVSLLWWCMLLRVYSEVYANLICATNSIHISGEIPDAIPVCDAGSALVVTDGLCCMFWWDINPGLYHHQYSLMVMLYGWMKHVISPGLPAFIDDIHYIFWWNKTSWSILLAVLSGRIYFTFWWYLPDASLVQISRCVCLWSCQSVLLQQHSLTKA